MPDTKIGMVRMALIQTYIYKKGMRGCGILSVGLKLISWIKCHDVKLQIENLKTGLVYVYIYK